MARTSSYTYNPKTGTWSKSTTSDTSTPQKTTTPANNNSTAKKTTTKSSGKTASKGSSNLTSSTSNKNSSAGKTEKAYNEQEKGTLEGDLNFIATEETIKLNAGDTVSLLGLGKSLSGSYYVTSVTRSISSSGYSHSASVIKTDFGNSLKIETTSYNDEEKEVVEEVSVSSPKKATETKQVRTHKVKKGETVYSIAKKYYKDGNKYKKLKDAKTGKSITPKTLKVGQTLNVT